jgi:hypothetical protein
MPRIMHFEIEHDCWCFLSFLLFLLELQSQLSLFLRVRTTLSVLVISSSIFFEMQFFFHC